MVAGHTAVSASLVDAGRILAGGIICLTFNFYKMRWLNHGLFLRTNLVGLMGAHLLVIVAAWRWARVHSIAKFATLCLLRVVAVQVVGRVYLAKLIIIFHLLACIAHRPMDGHPVVRDTLLLFGSTDPTLARVLQFVLMRLLVALLLLIEVNVVGHTLFLAVGCRCLGQSLVHLLRNVLRLRLVQRLLATSGLHSVMGRIGGDILIIIY